MSEKEERQELGRSKENCPPPRRPFSLQYSLFLLQFRIGMHKSGQKNQQPSLYGNHS
jgi:hypothetical protein